MEAVERAGEPGLIVNWPKVAYVNIFISSHHIPRPRPIYYRLRLKSTQVAPRDDLQMFELPKDSQRHSKTSKRY